LSRLPAVRLFVERAQAANPRFTLTEQHAAAVAAICRRLDGIPLAIELAAARVRVLAPEQLASRLDQRFRLLTGGSRAALPRQQTLQALVDWSYQLLTPPERRLFDRLSVFAGGCTLEAAEAVGSADDLAAEDVLDLLARLVDKSLVVAEEQEDGTERYRLLETLRQYGRERLLAGDAVEAVHQRHADHYRALAAERAPQFDATAAAWASALAWCDQEHDNLLAALRWLIEQRQAEESAGLSAALRPYWFMRGLLAEATRQSSDVLDLCRVAAAAPAALVEALGGRWSIAGVQGDWALQLALEAEYEQLAASLPPVEQRVEAELLGSFGLAARESGNLERAQALFERSLALYRQLGNQTGIAQQFNRLGTLAHLWNEYAAAHSLFEQSLAVQGTSEATRLRG
jgi:predicted ATPase